MKKILVLTLFLVSTVGLSQNASDAKKLLDEVSEKVMGYNNISLEFKYSLSNQEANVKQETRGNVIIEGDKYLLNILGTTRIFDGKNLYSISPEDEEVTISNEDINDENAVSPSKMLVFYKNGYTYQMDINQNIRGRKIQYVKLTPISSVSEIKYILLGIDAQTKHVYNLIEIGKNGTKTTLTVNSFKTNQELSKSLFTFDESKYTDYYINRLD